MKLGIIITTYNRPEYLQQCFDSIRSADIPKNTLFIIIDDFSTDKRTSDLISDFFDSNPSRTNSLNNRKPERRGIADSIRYGFTEAFYHGCDVVMNLDSDAIVRNDFVHVLLELHKTFPDHIITGFNCLTSNRDGSQRHEVLSEGKGWNTKKSVGGINMCANESIYKKYLLPALEVSIKQGGNWDHMACINSEKDGKDIICSVPSVVQHIGIVSSLGHSSTEEPDTAQDFKNLHLPNVTLIGADCVDISRLIYAAEQCMRNISFGAVKLLTSLSSENKNTVHIKPLRSKEQYSKFMIKELADYVDTDYALTIQYDGYVINATAWKKEFFEYDFIGGPWWYGDKKNVGNGGFSLRSKKLLEALKNDDIIEVFHPEDHHICRTYRDYLEIKYKIKYAPEEVAEKFSIDGFKKKDKRWNGQFGFHGGDIIIPQEVRQMNGTVKQGLIISQFAGLGDILFCMPLVMDWVNKGHKVIWAVIPEYLSIKKHFPEIVFIDKNLLDIDYEKKYEYEVGGMKVIPLRWAEVVIKTTYKNVMRAKYDMYGTDFNRWRSLKWKRDTHAENYIFKFLGLEKGERYNLINKKFRSDQTGTAAIHLDNGLRNIEMINIPNTTMLDWGKVIENAEEIHTVHTSVVYMMEVLKTTDKLHQYLRKPDEKDFSLTDYLWKKKWHFHY